MCALPLPTDEKLIAVPLSALFLDVANLNSSDPTLIAYTVDDIFNLTKIDRWFLHKLHNIHQFKSCLQNHSYPDYVDILIKAKKLGFSDKFIAVSYTHLTLPTR